MREAAAPEQTLNESNVTAISPVGTLLASSCGQCPPLRRVSCWMRQDNLGLRDRESRVFSGGLGAGSRFAG
jgi:hypothetical protein